MKNLSTKWQKLIAYLTAYLGIVPFLIGGGYIFLKSDDEPAKKSVKMAFLLTIVFTVLEFIVIIVNYFAQVSTYTAFTYDAQNGSIVFQAIVAIVKFVAFTVAFCLDAFTMIKYDCIISFFGGMPKQNKTIAASKHTAGAAYATKIKATETASEEINEEVETDDASETDAE